MMRIRRKGKKKPIFRGVRAALTKGLGCAVRGTGAGDGGWGLKRAAGAARDSDTLTSKLGRHKLRDFVPDFSGCLRTYTHSFEAKPGMRPTGTGLSRIPSQRMERQ